MSPNQASRRVRLRLAVERLDGVSAPFPDEWLEQVAQRALDAGVDAGTQADVSRFLGRGRIVEGALLLADDAELRRLNRTFRQTDRPTDVLSFSQQEGGTLAAAPRRSVHLGDVAISVERAMRQAAEYGHSTERELAYLLAHGVLHLVGFDHQTDAGQAAMREAEETALAAVGLARPIMPEEVAG